MLEEIPFIKLIEMNGYFYFFDINTNNIIEVNQHIYNYLNAIIRGENRLDLSNEDQKQLSHMISAGLLKKNNGVVIEHTLTDDLETILSEGIPHICLQITQNCNLRCEYCVYSGSYYNRTHNNRRMTWNIARRALDFLKEHCGESTQDVIIGFYGGEPLLEWSLVRKCIEYCKEAFINKNLSFNITTNGTLLTIEIAKYLLQNNVTITISLDGPERVHDLHRKFINGEGTFDTVITNITEIFNTFPEEVIESQIMFNSVCSNDVDYSEVVRFFKENSLVKNIGFRISDVNEVNLKKEKPEQNSKRTSDKQYEYFKMFLYGVGRLKKYDNRGDALDYANLLTDTIYNRVIRLEREKKGHPGGPCVAGQHKLFSDVEGNLYPCERVSETSPIMKIGDIYNGIDLEAAKKIMNIAKISPTECSECWAFDYCTQCAAFADGGSEFSKAKRIQGCDNVRRSIESMIKDYIVLRRYNCEFERFKDIDIWRE